MALKSARNRANWFRRFGRKQSNVLASVWGRQVQPVQNNTNITLFTGAKIKGGWQQETNIIFHTKVNHH